MTLNFDKIKEEFTGYESLTIDKDSGQILKAIRVVKSIRRLPLMINSHPKLILASRDEV